MFLEIEPIRDWEYNKAVSEWGTKWEVSDMHYDYEVDGETGHNSVVIQQAWGSRP